MSEARHYPKPAIKARHWLPLHTHSIHGGFIKGRQIVRECRGIGGHRNPKAAKDTKDACPIAMMAAFTVTSVVKRDSQRSPMAGFDGGLGILLPVVGAGSWLPVSSRAIRTPISQ